ncbi:autotransporter outer membrane beta-barrel domain-containing protein [Pseudocitrobacter cyperus]|uniref:Autotransporter outer membrane beta-barrel domain-containing protein n=1 Tax=Pseudocitrobacter cyperus TaxID=3112843 RepID=A0ABV0HK65_9ENTR
MMVSCSLLPFSVFSADIEIADKENVSAIWSFNQSVIAPASTIKTANGNITVNGSVTVDSSKISSALAKYIIYTQGSTINLGQDSTINSANSANIITVEGGGRVIASDIDIIGTEGNYAGAMGKMYGINTIAPNDNASGTFLDFSGLTRLTLNNFTGDVVGIMAECAAGIACNTSQDINLQLENIGLNVAASENATGIEASGQNIAFNESSIVIDSEGINSVINGLVADNGVIQASGYTDLTVSGNGILTAVSASGEQANIDLQGGTAITLYRYQDGEQGATGIVANDGAAVHLSDSWITLYSNAAVTDTDRFLVAQNSLGDTASHIQVDGAFTAAIDSASVKPASAIYIGAEGNSTINLNGDVTLGDLRNADIATAFLAQENGQITMKDQKLTAWGNIIADDGAIELVTADNSYLYSTLSTLNGGTVNLSLNGSNSVWDMTGNSTLSSLALSGGQINFLNESSSEFKTLTVDGDYNGDGGTLLMNVTLNGDSDSPGDKMIVTGDSSGATNVKFNNIYGHGEHTDRGIELITIAGASDGQFALDRRVGIGLYDYALVQKGQNWYLSNSVDDITTGETEAPASETETDENESATGDTPANPSPPEDAGDTPTAPETAEEAGDTPVAPETAEEAGDTPAVPATPEDAGAGDETNNVVNDDTPAQPAEEGTGNSNTSDSRYDYAKVYRPESGSYIANIAAANTLFMTRLHDRQGEHTWADPVTGERHSTTMWMRNSASHNRFEEAGGQLISRSNNYTLLIGGDVGRWSTTGQDSLRFGLMTGYSRSNSHSRSQITGYTSRGKVNGYSAGLYATWFANEETREGAWVDSWMLYNWFDNEVSGHQMRTEKYRSRGITASLEAGYALPVGSSENFSYWLEPRGQAVLMNVKADDLTEEQGTRVSSTGDGNVMTQLGVRALMKGKPEKGISDKVKFYVESNWIHNTRAFGVRMNGEKNTIQGSQNQLEARVGVEGQMSDRLALWIDAGHQIGQNKYSESRGTLGIKYQF